MKKLKHYQEYEEFKIEQNYTNSVCVINVKGHKYILKKLEVPLNKKELNSQHNYIEFLLNNNINVAKIIKTIIYHDQYYELQEFVYGSQKINTKKLIEAIAKLHLVSLNYKNIVKREIIKTDFKCKNSNLDYLLIGFNVKYNKLPIKNLKNNFKLINKNYIKIVKELQNLYKLSYADFKKNYNTNSCIIHNDINSFNAINVNNKIYFIDFDLAIKSSEYVDFVDAIMKNYKSINLLNNSFNKFIINVKEYIKVYNSINSKVNLDLKGVCLMSILKLCSFYFYVMLREENVFNFNKNICILYNLCKKFDKIIKEND